MFVLDNCVFIDIDVGFVCNFENRIGIFLFDGWYYRGVWKYNRFFIFWVKESNMVKI